MRRQGNTTEFMEQFSSRYERVSEMRRNGEHMTHEDDYLMLQARLQGHTHSDLDCELDRDPWEEYNKTDKHTSLEQKLSRKLNQYPRIDLHSRTPYLNETERHKGKEKDDPQKMLYERLAKEHKKSMASLYKWNQIKMEDEVKTFKRYLKLPMKLAYGKNPKKQRRIIDPTVKLEDFSEFDSKHCKDILKDDFEVF